MRNLYRCDICRHVVEVNSWDQDAGNVEIVMYVASNNPMAQVSTNFNHQRSEFKKQDVCNPCRKRIAAGIAKVLEEIMSIHKEP